MTEHKKEQSATAEPRSSQFMNLSFIVLVMVVVLILFDFETHSRGLLAAVERWIENAGAAAPIGAILFTGLWMALCLPGPMVMTAMTTIFHSQPWLALIVVWGGDTLAEVIGFLVARRVARQRVSEWIGHKPWFQWLEEQVNNRGLVGVALIRAMPFFPNSLANYAFGLTSLSFWPYLLASCLGSLPNVALYVVGTAGILALFEGQIRVKHEGGYLAIGVLLLAVLAAWLIQRLSKRKLATAPKPKNTSESK